MALQTPAIARQWLGSNYMVTPNKHKSNSYTAIEEQCFLRGLYRVVISRAS
jgi:hypothetical protein